MLFVSLINQCLNQRNVVFFCFSQEKIYPNLKELISNKSIIFCIIITLLIYIWIFQFHTKIYDKKDDFYLVPYCYSAFLDGHVPLTLSYCVDMWQCHSVFCARVCAAFTVPVFVQRLLCPCLYSVRSTCVCVYRSPSL